MRRSGVLNRYSLLATLIGLSFSAAAQQDTQHYRGVITDQNGKPLTEARVHVHGRQQYVYSDQQGQFSIVAPADAELHISAKGYGDQFVTLSDKTSLNIALVQGGIERIVVAASGIHQTDLDMATPVTVLSGEELQRRSEPTLGETLKFEPGVHANYFGPVASSPVIRGLDGPRVRILNNGLDTADVSRVGPDHAISADAISAEQIEVLRGPATLLYGSGAIGGVINVVDNRIPRQLRAQSETKLEGRYADVSDEKTIALNHEGSTDNIAWHLDGFNRDTADYQLPRFLNDEGEIISKLENSWLQTHNLNAGVSLIGSAGLIGVSAGRLESDYGIPGHHHHEDEELHEDELHAEAAEPAGVYARLRQNRFSLAGEWYSPFRGIETLSLNTAYTDYQHQEIEQGAIGTTFNNTSLESRLSAEHVEVNGWHGLVGYHLQHSDYQALGDEAFTPDTDSLSQALFVLEEKQFGSVSAQLGARIEHSRYQVGDIVLEHDGAALNNVQDSFNALSASGGLVWEFVPGFSWALALSRSERAPSAAELYANGAHVATSSYELGLVYQLDDSEITLASSAAKKETANNIDLTFRSFNGDLTFTYNFFYNKVHNYLYLANTGLTMADLAADHDDALPTDDDHHGDIHDDFAVYQYQQHDATLYGAELSANYQLDAAQSIQLFVDTVRAKLDSGENLPRIPPVKLGLEYQYQGLNWSANLGLTRFNKQQKLATNETATGGYTLLDASISYDFVLSQLDVTAFLRATNLTDELAQVHSSFIKQDAPLPGRALTLGLRATF